MICDNIDYAKYNPIPGSTFRVGQREAIDGIVRAFEGGQKVITLDAPTSAGKSFILVAVGNILLDEYNITRMMFTSPQVNLIHNGNLFGLPKLTGRANYPCVGSEDFIANKLTADDCLFSSKDRGYAACDKCPYRLAKAKFINSPFAATTLARYQVDPQMATVDGIVIDESTNLFNALIESASLVLPDSIPSEFSSSSELVSSLEGYCSSLASRAKNISSICKQTKLDNKMGRTKLSTSALTKKSQTVPRKVSGTYAGHGCMYTRGKIHIERCTICDNQR